MQECMLIYRFVNGSDIITVASPTYEDARAIAFGRASEHPMTMLDYCEIDMGKKIMTLYDNTVKH